MQPKYRYRIDSHKNGSALRPQTFTSTYAEARVAIGQHIGESTLDVNADPGALAAYVDSVCK